MFKAFVLGAACALTCTAALAAPVSFNFTATFASADADWASTIDPMGTVPTDFSGVLTYDPDATGVEDDFLGQTLYDGGISVTTNYAAFNTFAAALGHPTVSIGLSGLGTIPSNPVYGAILASGVGEETFPDGATSISASNSLIFSQSNSSQDGTALPELPFTLADYDSADLFFTVVTRTRDSNGTETISEQVDLTATLTSLTQITVPPVPLPASMPILLVGLAGFGILARKPRKA